MHAISRTGILLILLVLVVSCGAQDDAAQQPLSKLSTPIGDFIVETFQDSRGVYWFGTVGQGVARYDGDSLVYLSTEDGLAGNAVVAIVEDPDGNLWFGTHSGLSHYDGRTFTNYTGANGLCIDRIANLLIDREGLMWIGAWGGICTFDGQSFQPFDLPLPNIEILWYQGTTDWVTELMEDDRGNIWFGRDGYGACRYDGEAFRHYTRADGLPSNNVQEIMQARDDSIWFTTRVAEKDHPDEEAREGEGGLARLSEEGMQTFDDVPGLSRNEIYSLYEDRKGGIWVGATGLGIYHFDGNDWVLYDQIERPDLAARIGIQSILEDKSGQMWFGFSGGLYRLQDSRLVHVGREGPWE